MENVYDMLKQLDIQYVQEDHPPVYTIEDMQGLNLDQFGEICKNLFLSDDKGKRQFLVVLPGQKRADLQNLGKILGVSKLRFASEKRLMQQMRLEKGAVTPLGVINNDDHQLPVYIDKELQTYEKIGVHPNTNCATVFLSVQDLLRYIEACGNPVSMISL